MTILINADKDMLFATAAARQAAACRSVKRNRTTTVRVATEVLGM